jgi:hypothetical protein
MIPNKIKYNPASVAFVNPLNKNENTTTTAATVKRINCPQNPHRPNVLHAAAVRDTLRAIDSALSTDAFVVTNKALLLLCLVVVKCASDSPPNKPPLLLDVFTVLGEKTHLDATIFESILPPPRLPPPPPRERNDDDCATAFLCLKHNGDVRGCCPVWEKSPCIGEDVSKCMRHGEIHTKDSRVFLCSCTNKKKRQKTLKSLALRSVKHKHTCDIHKRSHLSLSLSFFPSVRANGEEKKKESEGRRRNIEKEKVPR